MSLARFCRKHLAVIDPGATVLAAATRMREHHVGAVVVVADGRPVGILTDRDIVLRVIAQRQDPETTPVGTVMSGDLVCARIDDRIDDALARIREGGVRRLPVLGPEGELAGMLSLDDLIVLFGAEMGEVLTAIRSNRGP